MIRPKHVSASSTNLFTECRAKFAAQYDQTTKTYRRNEWTDKGHLLHKTIELFNDVDNTDRSKDHFFRCFDAAVIAMELAETLPVYKAAFEMLDDTWLMLVAHPTIPVQLCTTLANEFEMRYRPEGWTFDLMGYIDRVFIVTPEKQLTEGKTHITLGINDYKSGKPKTLSDLMDDIQVGFNLLWARDVMKPTLEEQGYIVDRIVAVWDYIGENKSVSIWEVDYDLDTFHRWMIAQTAQVDQFVKAFNEQEAKSADPADINRFLERERYETINVHCGYCQRKNVCGTFQKALVRQETIDFTASSWDAIWAERERFSMMARYGEEARKDLDSRIRAHMEQSGLSSIEMPDGDMREIYIQQNANHNIPTEVIREYLGDEFVLTRAKFSQAAVKTGIAQIFSDNPAQAAEVVAAVDARMVDSPGAIMVKIRKTGGETKKKGKKKA